jgi:hypothetical protein
MFMKPARISTSRCPELAEVPDHGVDASNLVGHLPGALEAPSVLQGVWIALMEKQQL